MKKLYLILWLLFLATISFAQLAKDQIFVIDDFSKMLKSHTSPYIGNDNSALDVLNVRVNEQYGSLVKRGALWLYGTCEPYAVTSLHRFYKSDSTKYLLATGNQYLDLGSDAGGACNSLKTGLTIGKRWNWVTYKNMAIGTNGYDNPLKYDGKTSIVSVSTDTEGARITGDVATELGAPFAELLTGVHLDASSWYQYKIAYFDGTNFSYSTARSNPILTGPATVHDIKLTDIPLGSTGTTARYIYRTVGDATKAAVLADTNYYLMTTINDNYTQAYSDVTTDAAILADNPPKWSTVSGGILAAPPKAKYAIVHKERLWFANDPSGTNYGKSIVYYSEILKPDVFFPTGNYFLVTPDDGDDITFIKQYLGQLYIGKTNSISLIDTTSSLTSNWSLKPPSSFVGCSAPYSAQTTPIGIVYLNNYGLFKFSGYTSQLFSDSVTKEIRDISPANYGLVSSVYSDNEYRLSYPSDSTGSAVNNRTLIYNLVRDSYVKDGNGFDSYSDFNSGTDFGTLYSGSSTTDGKIYAHQTNPDNYITRYQSELNAGTTDSVDIGGTEDFPTMELGWGVTIDDASFSGITIDGYTPTTAIIDRGKDTGYWYSPVTEIDAKSMIKLYWSANNGTTGTSSIAIRTDDSSTAILSDAWSSEYTNPSGSDISALSGKKYIQLRVKLYTSDLEYTPQMFIQDDFMVRLTYSRVGTIGETSVLSLWKSNWLNLSPPNYPANYPKIIKEMDIYYEGTAGTINFNIQNLKGDATANFTVDLSQTRNPNMGYFGTGDSKVFRYNFPIVPGTPNALYGDKFMITITDTGITSYKIQRISLRYDIMEYTPYR